GGGGAAGRRADRAGVVRARRSRGARHVRLARVAGAREREARAGGGAGNRRRPDRSGRRVLGRLPRLALGRTRARRRRTPGQRARRRDAQRATPMRALVRTAEAVYEVELEDEVVLG